MRFLLHVNSLDAFIGSNNGRHIATFSTLKKRLGIALITGQLLTLLYYSHNVSWSNALYWDLVEPLNAPCMVTQQFDPRDVDISLFGVWGLRELCS